MNVYESIVQGLKEAIELEKKNQKQRENTSQNENCPKSEKNDNNFSQNS